MNEHDSERLAGLLEARVWSRRKIVEDADVVVFNTCCIRENADNRLYGNLGTLRALKQVRPGMQIAVGGCLAQKDREKVLERAPWVDAVFGTHNVGHAADLLERARTAAHRSRSSSRLLQARRSSLLLSPFVVSSRSQHG
jgi:tRNA-2-methylthio-N6-dimethylallyladenosine synthase